MKTIYLLKSFLPFIFLPIAPAVVQVELERFGILAPAHGEYLAIGMQVLLTVGLVVWFARAINRRKRAKAFVKMSSLSKKVFHQDRWMTVEQYLEKCHNIVVSHGLTPDEWEDWVRESEAYLTAELPKLGRNEQELTCVPEVLAD